VILTVELNSDVPLYQQIRDRIVEAVAEGVLHAGDPLPSTRQLASDLGINFHTVNKAYDVLRAERLLQLNRRSGAVILRDPSSGPPADGVAKAWETRARTLLAEAIAHGMSEAEVIDRCQRLIAAFASVPAEPESNVGSQP
jgi:DNA-binding transcriptional regulator YhcF (GntR family)